MSLLRTLNALHTPRAEFEQAENAALVYSVNWAGLHPDIATSTWLSASGATIAGAATAGLVTSARIGGPLGTYDVVNKITTAAGDTDERIIRVRVRLNDLAPSLHGDYGERYVL